MQIFFYYQNVTFFFPFLLFKKKNSDLSCFSLLLKIFRFLSFLLLFSYYSIFVTSFFKRFTYTHTPTAEDVIIHCDCICGTSSEFKLKLSCNGGLTYIITGDHSAFTTTILKSQFSLELNFRYFQTLLHIFYLKIYFINYFQNF